ncbi:hypothetical protein EVAR_28140_1 [Eumeta japonica]|uniref:Secreted protein n=1 Tax=Eumeta variegata TaxID=151549 RepID=A0A4C1VDX3_EUMVA|nr:hypothetical protein EVAR_28140_1 [Eumeta japonica]
MAQKRNAVLLVSISWLTTLYESLPVREVSGLDATPLTLAGRIATGAVSHIGGSEGFSIGCRSRHNFLQNIGRCFLPYKVMNLFPGRVLGKCRVQPEPVARSLTHRLSPIRLTSVILTEYPVSAAACERVK